MITVIDRIRRYISYYNDETELEVRFGMFNQYKFISNIYPHNFYTIFKLLISNRDVKKIIYENTTDFISNKHVKKSVVDSTGKTTYVKKNKVKSAIDVYKYNFRISKSYEKIVDSDSFNENRVAYIRRKKRTKFIFDKFCIDMTIVNDNNYEIEIEYNLKKINRSLEEFFRPIKMIFYNLKI